MKTKGLCEICSPKQWKTISTEALTQTGYPVYGANGVIGHYNKYNHRGSTLLITCRGATCGTLNICEPYSYVNGNAMALDNLSDEVDLKFLFYYLLNRGLKDTITGSAQPQIVRQSLQKVSIEYPSLEIQNEIVYKLDKVSDLITLRRRQLAKLDELVKARFVEMFGDPVKNTMNWPYKSLNSVCDGIGDGLHGTPEYDDNGDYPFINGNNLIDGSIVVTPATKMVAEHTYKAHLIDICKNAILISINGTLGKLAFYRGEKVMLGKSACYCNLKPNINKVFVYGVMNSDAFAEFLDNSSTKSTIKNVGLKAMREYQLILPPMKLQEQFAAFATQIGKSKLTIQQSLDKLELLKKSLMQQYFG